jgi:hypothetical protein
MCKRTMRGWPAARFVKIVARVTAATSFAWFLTVTEAGQWSPGRSAVLDLSLEEFVARANSFLNRSMKKAPLYAEPASVIPSDGVFTRTFRWAGREGHVQFIVVANEKLGKIRDVSVQWRAADEAEMLQGALGFATLIAAVSPKLSANERREIAAALLKISRSDSEKDVQPRNRRRSLLVHVHAAGMPRRIGPSAEAMNDSAQDAQRKMGGRSTADGFPNPAIIDDAIGRTRIFRRAHGFRGWIGVLATHAPAMALLAGEPLAEG